MVPDAGSTQILAVCADDRDNTDTYTVDYVSWTVSIFLIYHFDDQIQTFTSLSTLILYLPTQYLNTFLTLMEKTTLTFNVPNTLCI